MRGCSCRGTAGFAHVSCLAEQAKILVAEAEENNLSLKVLNERWARWSSCSLCEQQYQGVVKCALGWACWKAYLGRPEEDGLRRAAMTQLGERFSRCITTRGRVVRARGRTVYTAAPWRTGSHSSLPCRTILRTRINFSDGLTMPYECGGTYTLNG